MQGFVVVLQVSQRGIPKDLLLDELNQENYNGQTSVYNLQNDAIADLWNSKFMRDFRMKMLEVSIYLLVSFVPMEASGLTSQAYRKKQKI